MIPTKNVRRVHVLLADRLALAAMIPVNHQRDPVLPGFQDFNDRLNRTDIMKFLPEFLPALIISGQHDNRMHAGKRNHFACGKRHARPHICHGLERFLPLPFALHGFPYTVRPEARLEQARHHLEIRRAQFLRTRGQNGTHKKKTGKKRRRDNSVEHSDSRV